MFAGHVGAGLALARGERRVNVGVFVAAGLALDGLLWAFVLVGWESLRITPDHARTHQPEFEFPWSHGLAAALVTAALAGAVACAALARLGSGRRRAAVLVAAAVLSHWLLDALVHTPGLPLAGPGSPRLGLGLWQQLPLGLALEGLVLIGGLVAFVAGSRLPRGRLAGLCALALLTLAFTVAGMTLAPPPPSARAMAASSALTLVVVCALFGWLGRRPRY